MKLSVDRNELWKGISTVLDAVPSKPAQPVLSNLLLDASDGGVTLGATDLDLSMSTRISAQVDQPGRVAVPARTLAEIAREWPESVLKVSVEDGRLVVSGSLGPDKGEGRYSLATAPPEEFPEMPDSIDGVTVDFEEAGISDGQLLRSMIDKTSFAVSRDETRPVLNGVLWRLEAEHMAMVATDGSRLAEFKQQWNGSGIDGLGEGTEVILPPQVCAQISKLLEGSPELRKVTVGPSQVLFELGETRLLSRLIEGPYVDYEQVVPRDNDKSLTVPVDEMLPAVRRVSILSSSYTHQVRMSLSDDAVELNASSQEIGGEAREQIPGQYAGEPLDLAYNAQYLIEILRKMGAGNAVFDLRDSVTAAIVRPSVQAEGEDSYYLLMPMRPSS
jgi:DNA polymerase-3 subunit beta